MKIFTIGSGAWGIALSSVLLKNGHDVTIFTRHEDIISEYLTTNSISKYFSETKLPKNLFFSTDFSLINDAEAVLIAIPSKNIAEIIKKINENLTHKVLIINATKGLEPTSNLRIQEFISKNLNADLINGLASVLGPGFAREVILENITCINSVSSDEKVGRTIQELFSNNYFRVYYTSDVIGAEFASSIKNAIAIASGILFGLGYKENSKAALITRGLNEITRFGLKKGAKKETFFGLSGVGDLILTCNSSESRNFKFGKMVAECKSAKKALLMNKDTIEGVYTIKVIYEISKHDSIDMPIINSLYQLIYEDRNLFETINDIMKRPLKNEDI